MTVDQKSHVIVDFKGCMTVGLKSYITIDFKGCRTVGPKSHITFDFKGYRTISLGLAISEQILRAFPSKPKLSTWIFRFINQPILSLLFVLLSISIGLLLPNFNAPIVLFYANLPSHILRQPLAVLKR